MFFHTAPPPLIIDAGDIKIAATARKVVFRIKPIYTVPAAFTEVDMNYTWKVFLRAYRLNGASDGECIAEIKVSGTTKHNEDIAERIARERSGG